MDNFYFLPHFLKKNTKAIHVVHGFSKNVGFRYDTKSNSFLSGYTSICPEATYPKKLQHGLVCAIMNEYFCRCGFNYTVIFD